MEHTEED
jgi:hypothetical protein